MPQYIVSSTGRVARLMKEKPPVRRYHRINVRDAAGKVRTYLSHVWILEAFVGPRPEGAVARHLNDNPGDNRLENLQWGSQSDNMQDAVINGRRKLKEHCPLGHPITGNNIQMTGHTSARCKACNQVRANAHWHKVPFTKEAADKRFEEVMR